MVTPTGSQEELRGYPLFPAPAFGGLGEAPRKLQKALTLPQVLGHHGGALGTTLGERGGREVTRALSPQNASNKVRAYFTQPVGKSKPFSLVTWRIQENDLSGRVSSFAGTSFLFKEFQDTLMVSQGAGILNGGRTCGLNIAEEPTVAHSPQLVLELCLTRKLLPSASQILQNSNPPPSQAQGVGGQAQVDASICREQIPRGASP